MLEVTGGGQPNNATYFTVGLDIATYSRNTDDQAGTMHWGGAPDGTYQGDL